jgi:hypothetical protein
MLNKIEFYKNDIDNPYAVNGFNGTWSISKHNLIPDVLLGFLQRHFGQFRIRRIPITDINAVLNELWEGPGSLEKIFLLEDEMRVQGKEIKFTATDLKEFKSVVDDEEDEDNLDN